MTKKLSKAGIFSILICACVTVMVGSAIAPALKEIAFNLGFEKSPTWLVTIPALGVVLSAPFIGKLIDRHGPYFMICRGLIAYAVFGVAGAFLSHPVTVILDRFLLGVATAAIAASGIGLIATFFEGNERMKILVLQGMSIEIGGVLFLAVGGLLGELGWQYPFAIYLIALVGFAAIRFFVPDVKPVLHVAVRENDQKITTGKKQLLSKRMWLVVLCALSSMILFFVAFTVLPQILPDLFGFTKSQTGFLLAFVSLMAVLSAALMPQVMKRLGSVYTIVTGFVFYMIALAVFSFAGSTPQLIAAAVSLGVGFGFTVPLLNHMTLEASEESNRGKNVSFCTMAIFLGQFLSSFVNLISRDHNVVLKSAATLSLIIVVSLVLTQLNGKKKLNKINNQ